MSRTVSGGFLSYSFGWKPFIGDLQKLGHLSQSVSDRLNWLKDTYGRSVRLGFQKSWDNNTPTSSTFESSTGETHTISLVKDKHVFRAGGYLFHTLERLEGIEGRVRAFSSALGLLNPSAVVWERIPYSFVADWFVRTNGVVNSLKLQPFPGQWNVRDISHSFSQEVEWAITCSGTDYTSWIGKYCGSIMAKRYNRGTGLPVSSSLLTTTELTTGQLALATALLVNATK
jgi:hypothetical protein